MKASSRKNEREESGKNKYRQLFHFSLAKYRAKKFIHILTFFSNYFFTGMTLLQLWILSLYSLSCSQILILSGYPMKK